MWRAGHSRIVPDGEGFVQTRRWAPPSGRQILEPIANRFVRNAPAGVELSPRFGDGLLPGIRVFGIGTELARFAHAVSLPCRRRDGKAIPQGNRVKA